MNRRRGLAAALAALLLAACAGVPRSITIGEAELQAQLARRFPMQRSLLDSVELQLSDPRLRVDAARARLATEFTLQASERRSGRSLQGRLALDYGLRFEATDATIRLVQPRVDSLELVPDAAVAPGRAELVRRLGGALAERLLDDLVLYRVPESRLQALRAAGLQPAALRVTADGVEITFAPLAPAPAKAVQP